MTTTIEYALMAGSSYISSRPDINKFPVPQGWTKVINPPHFTDDASGFEAICYTNGTEVVISFAGTQSGAADWIHGNIPLANGALSDQLRQAADYYLLVKSSMPAGTKITLTGHSLGGGLASLIAVLFDESAVTFDQAPFLNSAIFYETTDDTGYPTTRSVAEDLRNYLTGRVPENSLMRLDAYIAAGDRFNPDPNPADTLAGRETRVTDIDVQGEVLGYLPFGRIGSQADILNSNAGVSSVDLHSQALLSAFLQSDKSAASSANPLQTLSKVTFELTSTKGVRDIYHLN